MSIEDEKRQYIGCCYQDARTKHAFSLLSYILVSEIVGNNAIVGSRGVCSGNISLAGELRIYGTAATDLASPIVSNFSQTICDGLSVSPISWTLQEKVLGD